MPGYAFARSPRWILSHLAVGALITAMVGAGLWQLRRHDERVERNELIEQRAALAPAPLADALAGVEDPDESQFTRVEVTGAYRDADTVLVANRTVQSSPGFWVITPLDEPGGSSVLVARGFVGRSTVLDGDPSVWAAGDADVTIVGTLQPSVSGGVLAPDRELAEINRPDVTVLSEAVGIEDLGQYVQAESDPAALTPVPLPDLDEGPHRGYAAQWFIFSVIAVIGYPLILRRVARDRAGTLAPDVAPI